MTSTAQSELVLDHFYVGVEPEEFEGLLELTRLLSGCDHHRVQSGNDSWEGVYLSSHSGPYFEILRERRLEGLGIAFKKSPGSMSDIRRITQELSHLPWKTGTRVDSRGEPWFDHLSLGNYLDVQNTWFNAWIMHYHRIGAKRDNDRSFSIKRFQTLELTLGSNRADPLLELARWFPTSVNREENTLHMNLPVQDGSSFQVQIRLNSGDQKFHFVSLTMELEEPLKICVPSMQSHELEVRGSQLILRSKH